ncbi:MAG: aminotransferase class I/II-fold pyridoxal phosphate-dependent enzyme [Elusimicrobia bacterium]|nr:aminotransferase class I/II-fold pyridoxal phosphate-dependent enzyme [Elusimicrobiota bacterium]
MRRARTKRKSRPRRRTAGARGARAPYSVNANLSKLPPYLFVELDRKKREAIERGVDIINLGIGDPDLPTPALIVDRMAEAIRRPEHHRYPSGKGSGEFRAAVARYMDRKFGVKVDPATEVLALLGSKEGIGHLPLALASPGETVLVPDPGYPPYLSGTVFANAIPRRFVLEERNGFLPDLSELPPRARLLFLNYPNNPTGATATLEFLERAVAWARENGTWLAYDVAYVQAYYDGRRPPSVLQIAGAKDVSIEFHSFSKTYQMTGWRVAWACGNAKAIAALAQVKDNVDSGVFTAIQEAAAWGLDHGDAEEETMRRIQGARRRLFSEGLRSLGWGVFESSATFYLWCRPPKGTPSDVAVARLLEEAGIVATPGHGFGAGGKGYVRFALTQPENRLKEALARMAKVAW